MGSRHSLALRTSANKSHPVLPQLYVTFLLVGIGLCWTRAHSRKVREEGDHSSCLRWGKGWKGIFCFRLAVTSQMCSCCKPLQEAACGGSQAAFLSGRWVIPVTSLYFSAAPASPFPASHSRVSPWGRASWTRSGSARPLSSPQQWAGCVPPLRRAVTGSDLFWSDRGNCLSWCPHDFVFLGGSSGR